MTQNFFHSFVHSLFLPYTLYKASSFLVLLSFFLHQLYNHPPLWTSTTYNLSYYLLSITLPTTASIYHNSSVHHLIMSSETFPSSDLRRSAVESKRHHDHKAKWAYGSRSSHPSKYESVRQPTHVRRPAHPDPEIR